MIKHQRSSTQNFESLNVPQEVILFCVPRASFEEALCKTLGLYICTQRDESLMCLQGVLQGFLENIFDFSMEARQLWALGITLIDIKYVLLNIFGLFDRLGACPRQS